jgi:hypothetical protein
MATASTLSSTASAAIAQFARDPGLGLAANGQLIREVMGKLLEAAAKDAELGALPVGQSLEAASAKIWPMEDDLTFTSLRRDLAGHCGPMRRMAATRTLKWVW